MPQVYEPRKTIRVVANNAANRANNQLKTVNIITTKANDPHNSVKPHLQAAGVPTQNLYPTVIDSGGSVIGLQTIYIAGYSAPA